MKKYTQKELKNLVRLEAATELNDCGKTLDYRKADTIAYSVGKYGMNGALLKDRETGKLYAITARNSALFYYL